MGFFPKLLAHEERLVTAKRNDDEYTMKKIHQWSAAKAKRVLSALKRQGWSVKRQKGSHRVLTKPGWPDFTFAYHDKVEIGPNALELLGKKTGLSAEDL